MQTKPAELKVAIIYSGLSQKGLAHKSGITRNYLNQVINQKKEASHITAKKIADALGKDMEELFEIREG